MFLLPLAVWFGWWFMVYIAVQVGYLLRDRWLYLEPADCRRRHFARWFNNNASWFWEVKAWAFWIGLLSGSSIVMLLILQNNERLDSEVVTLYTTSSGGEVVEMQSNRRDIWDGRTVVVDDDQIWRGQVVSCTSPGVNTNVARVKYSRSEVDVVVGACRVGENVAFRAGRLRVFGEKQWFYFPLTELEVRALVRRGFTVIE